ncbi:hypothetical protein T310_4920 [Rasamsonia emersonii CBS 393.64]|uniref:Uncharacterized protein n=1 Tax=Rasamsonia emersonii (strain ATCC 16479 / CBS 393.64 / IMI 116815) TaxID=1408163 RepID=A0A0F4YT93_RASE3|nr:hypothetical protein T310_4920 [Rasamsonia emersonii CBS 393.64]KKA21061.1 hypothetical protein T310_4920 [Rasamsonia emersonii CBS 393.64]
MKPPLLRKVDHSPFAEHVILGAHALLREPEALRERCRADDGGATRETSLDRRQGIDPVDRNCFIPHPRHAKWSPGPLMTKLDCCIAILLAITRHSRLTPGHYSRPDSIDIL